jgi:hypothetical protein
LLNIVVVGVKRSVVGMLPSLGSESNLVNSVNCELLLTMLLEASPSSSGSPSPLLHLEKTFDSCALLLTQQFQQGEQITASV